jgi:Arc/MetJ family transcription regulator
VTKRLVDIDDGVLERARAASGAHTIKETVDLALRSLVDDALIRVHVDRLRREPLDVAATDEARRPRWPDQG